MLSTVLHLALPCFTGTLEDLLARAERAEVDIASLPLAQVIAHALGALRRSGMADADGLAGLVSCASRLILLKSAALLPAPPVPAPPETDEDPHAALEECLRQYRLFKLAAGEFLGREQEGLRSYPRLAPPPAAPAAAPLPGNVTLDHLLAVVQEVLRRRPPDPLAPAPRITVTVAQRLTALELALARDGQVSFISFIAEARSRIEVVVGFMAVLELIKRGRAAAEQREPFGDILIVALAPVAAAAD